MKGLSITLIILIVVGLALTFLPPLNPNIGSDTVVGVSYNASDIPVTSANVFTGTVKQHSEVSRVRSLTVQRYFNTWTVNVSDDCFEALENGDKCFVWENHVQHYNTYGARLETWMSLGGAPLVGLIGVAFVVILIIWVIYLCSYLHPEKDPDYWL